WCEVLPGGEGAAGCLLGQVGFERVRERDLEVSRDVAVCTLARRAPSATRTTHRGVNLIG
ncbi:hypothetical protein K6U27_20010, partial [Vibrio fluvialis]|uniref:hypothetical protein n=1 Tax=Vibrio fluvialis TaxID=676 RepID=UPI001EEBC30E